MVIDYQIIINHREMKNEYLPNVVRKQPQYGEYHAIGMVSPTQCKHIA